MISLIGPWLAYRLFFLLFLVLSWLMFIKVALLFIAVIYLSVHNLSKYSRFTLHRFAPVHTNVVRSCLLIDKWECDYPSFLDSIFYFRIYSRSWEKGTSHKDVSVAIKLMHTQNVEINKALSVFNIFTSSVTWTHHMEVSFSVSFSSFSSCLSILFHSAFMDLSSFLCTVEPVIFQLFRFY
jgi:hypothetical protein